MTSTSQPAPLHVVVLAAGQGKRMHSDLPKVLQPLAGKPLLAHVLRTAGELGPAGIHVVHGHGGERVQEAFAHATVAWAHQAEQLGTGHALMQAMPGIGDERVVLVLYGDVPLVRAPTLQRLVDAARGDRLALLTAELPDPTGYGRIVRAADGAVTRIVEEKDATPQQRALREINTGLLAGPARRLRQWLGRLDRGNAQSEYYLTDVVALAVADGVGVTAVAAPDASEIHGINDKAQLAQAEAHYRQRHAETLLRGGVTLADPARIDVRGHLHCGRDVYIDVNVVFEGDVLLGDRVRIGPNSVVRDSEIGDDAEVYACSVVEGAHVGRGCRVGPFARLRPETVLQPRARVGNFVEVKKSRVGEDSKVNHLSYVGDAEIGAGVNVGAGTITCNYDGANKHRTVIEDGAFIGSGSELVAPVTIGAGAYVGSGSTITRDAPPGQLTLARARQTTIPAWKAPAKRQG
jgi:bifunctional UDP-N-acetylglucosamine pyrophosphorylase / glucosamine-1-phosphate N-acetyltransferase